MNLNSPQFAAGSMPWGIFKGESAALPLESLDAVSYRGERNLELIFTKCLVKECYE